MTKTFNLQYEYIEATLTDAQREGFMGGWWVARDEGGKFINFDDTKREIQDMMRKQFGDDVQFVVKERV